MGNPAEQYIDQEAATSYELQAATEAAFMDWGDNYRAAWYLARAYKKIMPNGEYQDFGPYVESFCDEDAGFDLEDTCSLLSNFYNFGCSRRRTAVP